MRYGKSHPNDRTMQPWRRRGRQRSRRVEGSRTQDREEPSATRQAATHTGGGVVAAGSTVLLEMAPTDVTSMLCRSVGMRDCGLYSQAEEERNERNAEDVQPDPHAEKLEGSRDLYKHPDRTHVRCTSRCCYRRSAGSAAGREIRSPPGGRNASAESVRTAGLPNSTARSACCWVSSLVP